MRAPSAARVREMRPPRFLAPPATRTTLPCRFCSGICLLLILSERRSAARPRPSQGRARPPPTGKQVVGRLRTVGDLGLSALAAGDPLPAPATLTASDSEQPPADCWSISVSCGLPWRAARRDADRLRRQFERFCVSVSTGVQRDARSPRRGHLYRMPGLARARLGPDDDPLVKRPEGLNDAGPSHHLIRDTSASPDLRGLSRLSTQSRRARRHERRLSAL